MRDSDLPTVLISSLPIIFKRTAVASAKTVCMYDYPGKVESAHASCMTDSKSSRGNRMESCTGQHLARDPVRMMPDEYKYSLHMQQA